MTPEQFLPTAPPLSAQDIHPDELKVILAEAEERHAEAAEALAAAQDHFDAAERRQAYALSEEQKRAAREQEAQVRRMRDIYSAVVDDVERYRRMFVDACSEAAIDASRVFDMFAAWARSRATADLLRQTILRYDSEQSRDAYESWMRRIAGWVELIRSVTSWQNGGVPANQQDDLEGLAEVNARINRESQDGLRPLNCDATDRSTPSITDVGFRDPNAAGIDAMFGPTYQPLEFNAEFSRAITESATSWARGATQHLRDVAAQEFADTAATRTEAS